MTRITSNNKSSGRNEESAPVLSRGRSGAGNRSEKGPLLAEGIDNLPVLVYHVDFDGKILDCNLAAVRTLGYHSKDELKGRPVVSTIYPAPLRKRAKLLFEKWKKEGVLRNERMEVVTKLGERRIVLLNVDTVWDKVGKPACSLSTQIDITEYVTSQRQAEKAKALNEERLNSLLKLNEMREKDLTELARFALGQGEKLTKSQVGFINFLSEDEEFVSDVVYTENTQVQCERPIDTSAFKITGSGLWSEAYRQRRPFVVNEWGADGVRIPDLPSGHPPLWRFMSIPVFEGDHIVAVAALGNKEKPYDLGDVRQFRLLMQDLWEIIRRRRAEESLQLSEEKFRALYENASDGIFLLDDKGAIQDANPQMLSLLGYEKERLQGTKVRDLIHPDDLTEIPFKLNDVLAGRTVHIERRMRRKDGVFLILDVSVRRIRPDLIQAIYRDVTEHRQMAKDLLEKQEALTRQTHALEEMNTALRVLLQHQDKEKAQLEQNILENVKKLVFPYLDKLWEGLQKVENKTYLEIAKTNLGNLISPISRQAPLAKLSPTELQVADMVKYGKSSKEIASLLCVSHETVRFHRKNIRKKLELDKKPINLRSYLSSLES